MYFETLNFVGRIPGWSFDLSLYRTEFPRPYLEPKFSRLEFRTKGTNTTCSRNWRDLDERSRSFFPIIMSEMSGLINSVYNVHFFGTFIVCDVTTKNLIPVSFVNLNKIHTRSGPRFYVGVLSSQVYKEEKFQTYLLVPTPQVRLCGLKLRT